MSYLPEVNVERYRHKVSPESGATIIEVMIAVLIFSIGLLGILSTQTMGLTNTQSALNRSYAAQLSYEIVDMVRLSSITTLKKELSSSTPVPIPGSLGNVFDGFATTAGSNNKYAITANCLTKAFGCSAQEMAQTALAEWESKLEEYLPDASAKLDLDSPITGSYTLEVTWVDFKTEAERLENKKSDNPDGKNYTYSMGFRP